MVLASKLYVFGQRKIPKNPGISFSKIPGFSSTSNPGIPLRPGEGIHNWALEVGRQTAEYFDRWAFGQERVRNGVGRKIFTQ